MGLSLVKKNSIVKNFIFKLWLWDAGVKFELIKNHLDPEDKILDIGSGPGSVTSVLIQSGFNVIPLDVEDLSFYPELKPKLFNGKNIPFNDHTFDVALILTVLHHAKDPKTLIREARRVAKKVIIIEDIYINSIQKYLLFGADSIANLQFLNHPRNNKTDGQWQDLFVNTNLKISHIKYRRLFLIFKQAVYFLSK